MPIFAYRCRACGKLFQTLVRSGETPVCEACHSADLDQQLSLIATPNKKAARQVQKRAPPAPAWAVRVAKASARLLARGNVLAVSQSDRLMNTKWRRYQAPPAQSFEPSVPP
jgi:putative FmdB family regulatory protein